ncbi:MAG TPA: universal stress protein [Burkholderiaceae bacterium]|nr:universal stress protein [Burkholderiaceae bacterium]
MSYKTILVHVDESERAKQRIAIAANIAVAQDAHLIGAAMTGVSRYLFQTGTFEQRDPSLAAHLELLRQRAEHALDGFEPIVKKMGVSSYEQQIVDDEAGDGVSLWARYSDLVVIGQTNPDEPSPAVASDFPEYVIMNAGRPVLIVPYAGKFDTVGNRVLVAWDASMEATRAVTAAIPLLKHANNVTVMVFNPSAQLGVHGEQPGADIALFLARHGIKVEVSNQRTDVDVGNALLSLAMDLSSDMIVMGGYGHSRFREILLGGVTRTVLASMTVPVLMAH